jgi:hypothetical protein
LSLESNETLQETPGACRNHLAPLPRPVAAVDSPHTLGDTVHRGGGLRERAGVVADRCGAALTPARVREPLIPIDRSDPKVDRSLHLLGASLPAGGRSLTLYEEVHPQKKLNTAAVHARVLRHLSTLIPPGAAPIVIADAGFKVPFHREVQVLGRRWVGRARGRDFVRLTSRWTSCKTLFGRATATPTALARRR